jgi:signal transduction histidine kinase
MQLANTSLFSALQVKPSLPDLTEIVCQQRSIQCRLILGFSIITFFTFLATSVAFFSCRSLVQRLYQIEHQSLPPIMELLAISQRASALAAIPANIARASTGAELEKAMGAATRFRSAMMANLAAIPVPREHRAELKALRTLIDGLSFNAVLLGNATAGRISLDVKQRELTAEAMKAHRKIEEALAPLLAGANTTLTVGLRQSAAGSGTRNGKNALRTLSEKDLPALVALMNLKAEINLIMGILDEVSLATGREQFALLRDRLKAATYRVHVALKALPDSPSTRQFTSAVADLLAFAGEGSIMDVRNRGLAAGESTRRLLRKGQEKEAKLAAAIEKAAGHSRDTVSQLVAASNAELPVYSFLLALLPVCSIAVLVGAYLFVRRYITRRLGSLRAALLDVAHGNLDVAVPSDGNDELAEMGKAVETFKANALKLRDLEAERTRNFDRANQALKAKSEFLANMSHELRTPMHAILSYAKLGSTSAATAASDASELGTYFKNIVTAGQRLLGLLNNLLDLAKLESGKTPFSMAPCDFSSILEEALLEMKPLLQEKSLTATPHIKATNTKLECDKQCMVRVMVNLLANSVKYSPNGSNIDITLCETGLPDSEDALCCSVADCGKGIPEDELVSVFDKFVQSSRSKTGAGGIGLGLAICREIVEAHGGRIWAENRKPSGVEISFMVARHADQDAR